MLRLHSESSCSYPGRPVRGAVVCKHGRALRGNMQSSRTGVSRGHSRHRKPPAIGRLETSLANRKAGMDSPSRRAEQREGKAPQCAPVL
jgi:hypothetical protein